LQNELRANRAGKFRAAIFRGLYPIIDTAACARAQIQPESLARAIARAGVSMAQFRHKGAFTREIFAQAENVGQILQAAGVAYVINDRADVALLLGADGLHLGQGDLPPARVRPVVGSSLAIGYSTHNRYQLLAGDREPVEYLAIGPIFATGSKENADPLVGVEELARLRRLTAKPLVAIGGITRANARAVLDAGADAVAVISDLLAADLEARLNEWLILTQR
jgi:thiamine-phosphate pyrophosphorylase